MCPSKSLSRTPKPLTPELEFGSHPAQTIQNFSSDNKSRKKQSGEFVDLLFCLCVFLETHWNKPSKHIQAKPIILIFPFLRLCLLPGIGVHRPRCRKHHTRGNRKHRGDQGSMKSALDFRITRAAPECPPWSLSLSNTQKQQANTIRQNISCM